MTTTTIITIEDIEHLAAELAADDASSRARLLRLITAEARILAVREPELFVARALAYADEDGHWNSSYPPEQEYKDRNGPCLLEVETYSWDEIATSGGFYYDWRAATEKRGVFVNRSGVLIGAEVSGTGRVGQFAAHPGNCGVDLTIEWSPLDLDDVSTEALRTVERVLRAKAFPLTAAPAPAS